MSPAHLPDDALLELLEMIEADLDDESPEVLAAFLERALELGALDALAIPTIMKKGRPGVRIELLCRDAEAGALEALVLRETSTLGFRRRTVERVALERREESVEVEGHRIRVKVALWEGRALKAKPELEDCRAVARTSGRPLREVLEQARAAARALVDG
ncbi:MAG: DUF111 family protein [Candidatus Sumerlaeia bacterium]|nr:DUF111 family protein [Candidatus Sumerlaeia bacterium]